MNGCIAFTGRHSNAQVCPYGEARYKEPRQNMNPDAHVRARDRIRKARKTYFYFPIIERLRIQYANPELARLLK